MPQKAKRKTNFTKQNVYIMKIKSRKIKTKPKYIFSYEVDKIKRQNLYFSVTYSENENAETYTDFLRWSELKKPKTNEIKILQIEVFKRNIKVCTLNQKNAKKLLNILDMYNSLGLINKEIERTSAPSGKEMIFCISLYFRISSKFTVKNLSFKDYLKRIAESRQFLQRINNPTEKECFEQYLTTSKSKRKISQEITNTTSIGEYLINNNLKLLVFEIMADYEKGYLKVLTYIPPTKTKKLSDKASLKEWGKFSKQIDTIEKYPKVRKETL